MANRLLSAAGLLAVALAATTHPQAQAPAVPAAAPPKSGVELASLDRSVRPQDDFYRFVNGGWVDRTPLPPDRARINSFSELNDRVYEQLRTIAEEAARPGAPASLRKVGDFYTAFMDEAGVEKAGLAALEDDLAAIAAAQTPADIARLFVRLSNIGVRVPIVGGASPDPDKPTEMAFRIGQGGLALPRDYYLVADNASYAAARDHYARYVTELLTLGGDPGAAQAGADVLAFETDIARVHWTNVQLRDAVATYNPTDTEALPGQYAGFDWPQWMRGQGVETARVIVGQPSAIEALARMVASAPVARWRTYLKAALLDDYAPYLGQKYVNAEFQLRGVTLGGRKVNQPRWRQAIEAINTGIGHEMARAYVARHFPPAAKARMATLIENLRVALGEAIGASDWMSAPTKAEARAKLAAFRANIGYPDKWRDFTDLEVRRDDLAGNVRRAIAFQRRYNLSRVGKPTDPDEFGMLPQVVNAGYNSRLNAITFPAGILQPPFFDATGDDAANYGAIGAVIGHEMGHGFDDQGRRSDAVGRLRDWWAPADATEYERRAARVVAQFDTYEVLPGVKVNGTFTLGENLGDLNGVEIAFRAYRHALGGTPAPVLDGFGGEQRFFMAYARIWRGKLTEAMARQQVVVDPHAPDQFRVKGPLVNIDAFHQAFGTKPGDGMWAAPEQRTRIW